MTEEPPKTVAQRQEALRQRRKELGLIRRDVWAHPDDWPKIRDLENNLQKKRKKS